MAESSEKLANFLLKSNINEIRSLLDEKKKKVSIIEDEFSAAHRISSVKERLTNLKAQILQLNFAKVIDAIDSTLKIQAVCDKFEETRKSLNISETPVITILDEDTDDKNDKKDPIIEDQEIEFIIEEDEVVQQEDKSIHKSNSSIKDSSLNQRLKSSKKQSKEENPAKSKRDIFKRLIKTKRKVDKEDDNEEEDEGQLTQGVKGKGGSRQQEQQLRKRQPRQSSVQQQYQQQILDEFFSIENGGFDAYETDYEEYQTLEDICEEDNTEEDEDYCESSQSRRLKKRGSLPQRKNIRKTSQKNNNNGSSSYNPHKKNTLSSEDIKKIQQKLTNYGTRRLQKGGEQPGKEQQQTTYKNKRNNPVKLPASYTEYLTHLINISSDNNLPIPKIFLNEQFYENRREGLNSSEILLANKEKQFVVKLLKALDGKIEKVEGYLLLPHELIVGLVQQENKKQVSPCLSPTRNEEEQEEEGTDDQIISTPRKKRIIDSEDDEEIEVEKKQKQQEIIGVMTEMYNEGDDSFECDFNVSGTSLLNKSKEGKKTQQQGSVKNVKNWKNVGENLREEIISEDLIKKQYNLNNEKELKKRIQTQNENNDSTIYNEESDEELRENADPKEFVDVTEDRNKIKAEKHGSDEQIYF